MVEHGSDDSPATPESEDRPVSDAAAAASSPVPWATGEYAAHPERAPRIDDGLMGVSPALLARDNALLESGYWFRYPEADRVCTFVERYCRHSKGKWRGQRVILESWQRRLLRRAFGWYRPDGTRRYRLVFLFVPRKNGKSLLCSAVSLLLTAADGERGPIVVCAATDEEQARVVFDEARAMVDASPDLRKRLEVRTSVVDCRHNGGLLKVVSSKVRDGESIHGGIVDEYHQHRTADLFESIETGTGARAQPMIFMPTTAGNNVDSPCYRMWEHAKKVRDGIVQEDELLPVIYGADNSDDWRSEAVWRKANPNLGVSIYPSRLRQACNRAINFPATQAGFLTKHLNIWVHEVTGAIPMAQWKACAGRVSRDLERYRGRRAYAGLDLAHTRDLTALVVVVPWVEEDRETMPAEVWDGCGGVGFDVLARFYCPAAAIAEKERIDAAEYGRWQREGWLVGTPGDVTDYAHVREDINRVAGAFDLREVGYDKHLASTLAQQLQDEDGVSMVIVEQTYDSYTLAMQWLQRSLLARAFRHGGNEVLTWTASNMVVKVGPRGGMIPDKKRSRGRIDGMPALLMAINRMVSAEHRERGGSRVIEFVSLNF
jgi:phage terminase large subunit-like protein